MTTDRETLKSWIREILKEELITVQRDGKSLVYDVSFDKKTGEITRGRLVKMSGGGAYGDIEDILERSRVLEYTSLDTAQIIKFVRNVKKAGGEILEDAPANGRAIAAKLNSSPWQEALSWPPAGKSSGGSKGVGEAAIHLAFQGEHAREPDFVAANGAIKLSVKSFPERGATVRSGTGGRDPKIEAAVSQIRAILGKGELRPSTLETYLQRKEPKEALKIIKALEPLAEIAAAAVLSEHDADGVIAIVGGEAKWYPAGAAGQGAFKLQALRSDNRIEVLGPAAGEGNTSWESVFAKVKDELRSGGKKSEPPAEPRKLRSIATSWDRRPGTGRVG